MVEVVVAAALRGEGWRTAMVEVVRLGLGFRGGCS